MLEDIEADGKFWIAGSDQQKVAGRLRFTQRDGGELILLGQLTDGNLRRHPREVFRIVGSMNKGTFTLDRCHLATRQPAALGGRQSFRVERLISGYEYDKYEPLEYDAITVKLTNLVNWINISGISHTTVIHENNALETHLVETQRQSKQVANVPCGQVQLNHSILHSSSWPSGISINEDYSFCLAFGQLLPLESVVDYAGDLQDLLSIATNRVSGFEELRLSHPKFTFTNEAGRSINRPASFYAQWMAQPVLSRRTLTDVDMSFTFEDLGGMEGVAKWMTAANKYRTQLGRVMNTIYNRTMYVQDIHLNRVAAIESFHKAWSSRRGKVQLATQLSELANLAGAPFERLVDKKKLARWCKLVRDERDNIAHHLGRQLHHEMSELYFLAESVYWLFVLVMLREAAIPEGAFRQLEPSPKYRHTQQELASFL